MPEPSIESDAILEELVNDFLARLRQGERPEVDEYVARYPELAEQIEAVFPALGLVEVFKPGSGDATGSLAGARVPGAGTRLERLGDFRLLREVGRGGMGCVYEAEQESLGRRVAIKVLAGHRLLDPKLLARFDREAKAAARLHHTNIVPVFGVGEQEGVHFYVMQFIQGLGLDAVLDEVRRLQRSKAVAGSADASASDGAPTAASVAHSLVSGRFAPPETPQTDRSGAQAPAASASASASSAPRSDLTSAGDSARRYALGVARIGRQVAEALAYAHEQGILHRDVKPSNLLLDAHGNVWVADFGLAKVGTDSDLTQTGDIIGTVRYMAPERFQGKCDARSDVYALGLTLYELLARRPAFEVEDRNALIRAVTQSAPPRLRTLERAVPRDLETIVHKAIEREPAHRYATASDLADDLRRFADDEPILARRASSLEQLARWGRRNPIIAALSGAVGLLALVVICGLWYGKESARRAMQVQTALAVEARRAAAATEAANQALTSSQDSLRRTLYAAQINLAQAAWDSASPGHTLELLEATRPKPGEPDFRGFEWDYLRRQAHGERTVRKLPGFCDTGPLVSGTPTLSADGGLAAIVDRDRSRGNVVLIRETTTGRLVREIPIPAPGNRTRLAFSSDGARIALASGAEVVHAVEDHRPFGAHAFVWSLTDGRELLHRSWSIAGTGSDPEVALDRTGARIALASSISVRSGLGSDAHRGELSVLDVADGRERIHLTLAGESYAAPQLSPDGRLVAAAERSWNGGSEVAASRLRVVEVEGGRARDDLTDLANDAYEGRFSPDGRLLAMTSMKPGLPSALILYDLEAGRVVAREVLPGTFGTTCTPAFSPDGRLLVVASRDTPACQVRALPTGRLLRAASLGSGGWRGIAARSDGLLITLDSYGNAREWPLPSAESASLDSGRALARARGARLADGGRKLIVLEETGDPDRPTRLTETDVETGRVLRQLERSGPSTPALGGFWSQFPVSAGGSRVALVASISGGISSYIERLEVWDLASGQRLPDVDEGVLGSGFRVGRGLSPQAFDARGTRLALHTVLKLPAPGGKGVIHRGSAVSIVELPSGRLLRRFPDKVNYTMRELALRPDGKLLAVPQVETTGVGESRLVVELSDTDSGQLVRTLRCRRSSGGPDLLAFSPDGRRLALACTVNRLTPSRSDPVVVWDLAAGGDPEPLRLDGHVNDVVAVAFSPDGRRLATAALRGTHGDCEVKLWDLASGRNLVTWAPPGGTPLDLAFDPDGRRLRLLLSDSSQDKARIVLFEASPLDPEVEAIDVVDRLDPAAALNSELAARIEAEPGLDPAVRAAALAAVPLRQESVFRLTSKAGRWLGAADRTPELMRRALAYIERVRERVHDLDRHSLAILGEARYRNGLLAECLEPLRRSLALQEQEQDNSMVEFRNYLPLLFLAMAEAKLGHRAAAQAALDDYRARRAQGFVGSASIPSDEKLLAEAEAELRAAFGVPPAVAPTPVPKP